MSIRSQYFDHSIASNDANGCLVKGVQRHTMLWRRYKPIASNIEDESDFVQTATEENAQGSVDPDVGSTISQVEGDSGMRNVVDEVSAWGFGSRSLGGRLEKWCCAGQRREFRFMVCERYTWTKLTLTYWLRVPQYEGH